MNNILSIEDGENFSAKILTKLPYPWPRTIYGSSDPTVFATTYLRSVFAFRCTRIRANAAASIPWGIFRNDEEVHTPTYVNDF